MKVRSILVAILLLMPLITLDASSFDTATVALQSHEPCHMDDCNPLVPNCPLCPFASSSPFYLPNGIEVFTPTVFSPFILVNYERFSDQGFVKAIFRPPIYV